MPELIRCIVLDDEHPAIELVSAYIEKTPGMALVLKTIHPEPALALINSGEADLLFLDVQMPTLTGIEFMQLVKQSRIKVILTTAYAQYALVGYEHNIVDYLLKPITYERFIAAAGKARERLQLLDERPVSPATSGVVGHIFVKIEYRLQKVNLDDILFIEAMGDYVYIHTTKDKILSLERMKHMEATLPASDFLRVHKSHIINIRHIDYLERGRIVINKVYFSVGESYKEAVRERLGI